MTAGAPRPLASILLIDDHAVIASPMLMALQAGGFGPGGGGGRRGPPRGGGHGSGGVVPADIVLLDLHLGRARSGLPMIAPVLTLGAKVILFTASDDPRMLATGLRAGAEAVIDKAMPFHGLVSALTELAARHALMAEDERATLLELLEANFAEEDAQQHPFARLTAREDQVLRHLIDGRSPKEIARSESISLSTVRGHIDRVLGKLRVSSQREALAAARAAGWPSTRA